jgi:hypothetical protein
VQCGKKQVLTIATLVAGNANEVMVASVVGITESAGVCGTGTM